MPSSSILTEFPEQSLGLPGNVVLGYLLKAGWKRIRTLWNPTQIPPGQHCLLLQFPSLTLYPSPPPHCHPFLLLWGCPTGMVACLVLSTYNSLQHRMGPHVVWPAPGGCEALGTHLLRAPPLTPGLPRLTSSFWRKLVKNPIFTKQTFCKSISALSQLLAILLNSDKQVRRPFSPQSAPKSSEAPF